MSAAIQSNTPTAKLSEHLLSHILPTLSTQTPELDFVSTWLINLDDINPIHTSAKSIPPTNPKGTRRENTVHR